MKMKLLPAVALVATMLFMGCSGGTGGSGDAVAFKFNVPKGTKFDYSVGMDMNMNQSIMGKEMKVNSKITMAYLFEVLNDSAGWKTLSSTISRIAMNMDAGGMSMHYDSDSTFTDTTGATAQVAKIFGAMKGGQFVFTMNENGEVGHVSGMQEMVQRIVSNIGGDAALMSETMNKTFNEQSFKQNLQQSFAMYPGKPVKPGDSWNKTLTMDNNGMAMKLDNVYTLESVTGNVAKVKVASKITSGGSSGALAGVQMELTGDLKGINNFDLPTGMPLNGDDNMEMNMKMHMQGQEVPMKMAIKVTIEGKKM